MLPLIFLVVYTLSLGGTGFTSIDDRLARFLQDEKTKENRSFCIVACYATVVTVGMLSKIHRKFSVDPIVREDSENMLFHLCVGFMIGTMLFTRGNVRKLINIETIETNENCFTLLQFGSG